MTVTINYPATLLTGWFGAIDAFERGGGVRHAEVDSTNPRRARRECRALRSSPDSVARLRRPCRRCRSALCREGTSFRTAPTRSPSRSRSRARRTRADRGARRSDPAGLADANVNDGVADIRSVDINRTTNLVTVIDEHRGPRHPASARIDAPGHRRLDRSQCHGRGGMGRPGPRVDPRALHRLLRVRRPPARRRAWRVRQDPRRVQHGYPAELPWRASLRAGSAGSHPPTARYSWMFHHLGCSASPETARRVPGAQRPYMSDLLGKTIFIPIYDEFAELRLERRCSTSTGSPPSRSPDFKVSGSNAYTDSGAPNCNGQLSRRAGLLHEVRLGQ